MEDLAQPLPPLRTIHKLERAWETLRTLRSFYPELVQADRDPLQLFIGQMRYAVHTLGFEESSRWQKTWALYTAARTSEQVRLRQEQRQVLRVDWLETSLPSEGWLGLTILPGRRDYGRSLADDLSVLREERVVAVLCLVPDEELARYGMRALPSHYRREGFELLHCPVLDQGTSSTEEMEAMVRWIDARLEAGERVVLHCVGGLGRSGMVAACYLKSRGLETAKAIEIVRAARSARAIESAPQEAFVSKFSFRLGER